MKTYYVANRDDLHSGWGGGCIVWWRERGHGYTTDLNDAGIFTDEDRRKNYPPRKCAWVPCEVVDAIAKTTRRAWWSHMPDGAVAAVLQAAGEAR